MKILRQILTSPFVILSFCFLPFFGLFTMIGTIIAGRPFPHAVRVPRKARMARIRQILAGPFDVQGLSFYLFFAIFAGIASKIARRPH
jgi:hypothetical protein